MGWQKIDDTTLKDSTTGEVKKFANHDDLSAFFQSSIGGKSQNGANGQGQNGANGKGQTGANRQGQNGNRDSFNNYINSSKEPNTGLRAQRANQQDQFAGRVAQGRDRAAQEARANQNVVADEMTEKQSAAARQQAEKAAAITGDMAAADAGTQAAVSTAAQNAAGNLEKQQERKDMFEQKWYDRDAHLDYAKKNANDTRQTQNDIQQQYDDKNAHNEDADSAQPSEPPEDMPDEDKQIYARVAHALEGANYTEADVKAGIEAIKNNTWPQFKKTFNDKYGAEMQKNGHKLVGDLTLDGQFDESGRPTASNNRYAGQQWHGQSKPIATQARFT
ncbi:MAG: hypothetical protein Pg6A_20120 [Termitinemataceae bacterium]|nr:MAG: hypothetical protein Pg6A_20120 [Termitinemataceae bacterium]